MRKSQKILTSIVAAFALLAGFGATAEPASAASAGVYIVAAKSWGWCPNIAGRTNTVWSVSVNNTTTGYSQTDYRDDIGWVKAKVGSTNTVHVNIGCTLGHGSTGTVVKIVPRRNGQAFYVSPSGYSWGN